MNTVELDRALNACCTPWHVIRDLVEHAAKKTGVPVEEIQGNSRVRRIAWTRQSVYYAARMEGISLTEIGDFFGRDHTSVLHGIRAVKKRMQTAPAISS